MTISFDNQEIWEIVIIQLTDNENGLEIRNIEIRSIIEMSSLRKVNSSLRCDEAMKKRLIIDNNYVESIGLSISDLGRISSNLRYKKRL